jgi:glucose/arabinose dehydrogenase
VTSSARLALLPAALALAAGCAGLFPQVTPPMLEGSVTLPPGFTLTVFARDLGHPRLLRLDPAGTLLVSVPRAGRIVALPDLDGDGVADRVVPVVEGLDLRHGLDFVDGVLYVAETGRVVRMAYDPGTLRAASPPQVVVPDLPRRGAHWTRTLVAGPDRRLYVAVGSSCNSCLEADPRRAAITRFETDGSGETRVATGLRNAVGLAFRPGTGELWATGNGRDWLGDDEPADIVTRVEPGGFYGWPHCHFGPAGPRPDPDPALGGPGRCQGVTRPTVLHQAHTAPLGLAFYPGGPFPPEYRGSLFVALHGSWNRTTPVGYQVVRVRLDTDPPRIDRFADGWLAGGQAWGRPVDVAVGSDGSLFVSDDLQGAIYRIAYRGGQ